MPEHPTPPLGAVLITPEKMYSELQLVASGQQRVLTGLEHLERAVNRGQEQHATRISDHETRLRAVEKKLWAVSGAAGLVGALVSQVFVSGITGG